MSLKSDSSGLVQRLGVVPGFQALSLFHKRYLFRLVIEYMFGLKSQKQITADGVHRTGIDLTNAIATIKLTGGCTVFKLWLYYVAKTKLSPKESAKTARLWGVARKDIREGSRLPRTFMRELSQLPYEALTLQQYQSLAVEVCKATDTWRDKFTYRKLRFIYQSSGFEQKDISHDLMLHGLRSLGVTYPRLESPLHAVNVAKRAMSNQGKTIIKSATTEKRRRLVRTSQGDFEAVVTPISDIQANTMPCESAAASYKRIEFREAADSILNQFSGKKRQFLELLGGAPSPSFDSFLEQKRRRSVDSENAGIKLARNTHIALIAEFIGVQPVLCHKLLTTIQKRHANPFA